MFLLTKEKIGRDSLITGLHDKKAGALVTFEGWVRDHNEGKKVTSLEYQVYEELALKEGQKILDEAKKKFNLHHIACTHRFGHLSLEDIAVWVGATASHRDDAFRATRFVIDEIKLRLPVWKKEHYADEKAKWVFCRDHHTHVHFHEKDYYEKQARLTEQERLKSSKVLVVGAGGLGCPVLTSLATAGVGHITIADFDRVSISNIHRQPLYSPDIVGEKKVHVAANKLLTLNPFIHIEGKDLRVSPHNVEALLKDHDLILDCTDNLETKFLLHDACMKMSIPLIAASIYQFEGQIRTFVPGQGCLRCTHATTPSDALMGNCNDFGVLGASVMAIGAIQAGEALLWLMQKKNNTQENTFFMDLRTLSQMKIKNAKKENCPTCRGHVVFESSTLEVDAVPENAILVDVRDKDDSLLLDFVKEERPVIVCCHRGVRSKKLVQEMREKGHEHFYSLKGGATL
jgi:adenylyltransferase/sulfurtransferase